MKFFFCNKEECLYVYILITFIFAMRYICEKSDKDPLGPPVNDVQIGPPELAGPLVD